MTTQLALLAVLPAVVLLVFIYRADNVEKEPFSLMAKVFGLGALTTISAMILEWIGMYILSFFFYSANGLYTFFEMFFVVALAEEGGKYFVLKKATWKNPEFNFSFDGIVYAVCASLGFATLENIMYVYQGGLQTAIMRCITAVPGHCIFGVFMGIYYGLAKGCELRGNERGKKLNLRKALIIPILLHGLYDFSCSLEYDGMLLVFLILEIFMTVNAIKMVKRMSRMDMPLAPGVQVQPQQAAQPQQGQIMYQQSVPMQQAAQPQQGQVMYQQNVPVQQPVQPQHPVQPAEVVKEEAPELIVQSADSGPYNPNPVFTADSIEGR